MRRAMRSAVLIATSVAMIWTVTGTAEAAGKITVTATINEGPSPCSFTLYVATVSPVPIGGKPPGTAFTTGACGPAIEVPAGLYDLKVVNTTLWDQPEKLSRGIRVSDGVTKTAAFAFEAGMMHLNFTCTPCRAEVHKVGATATMSSGCDAFSRQLSTGTYDVRYQLGPELEVWKRGIAITKGTTVGVKPF